MTKYQYDTGKEVLTGSNSITRFIIKEWAKEGKQQFTAKEVDKRLKNLHGLNTPYKDNTGANLHSMCINSNSSKHYSNSKPDFLYLVDRGTFEIYDSTKHGNNVKQIESLINDLAVITKKREKKEIEETVAEVQILARKGQGRFRNDIKPWSKSSNDERLDGHNGFMFAPHIDALFDNGFISFDEKGKILISPQLDDKSQQALNISSSIQLQRLPEKTKKYLQYHRENVYMQD